MSETYNPGALTKFSFVLTNFDGTKKNDISPLVLNVSITEDILKNTLYGSAMIRDGVGLLEGIPNAGANGFPVVGEEFIQFSYTPKDQATITHRFFLYSVDNIEYKKSNRFKEYTINFCSEEHLIDATSVVAKSYNGLHSDSVQSLAKDFLFIDKADTPYKGHAVKTFNLIQPTKGQQKVIIPRLPPIQAAHFLARRSIAAEKYNSGTYLFFENFKGFNFCDIEYLIEKGIDKFKSFGVFTEATDYHPLVYRFEDPLLVMKNSASNPLRELTTIQSISHKKFFDTIEKLKRGYIESDTIVYDYVKGTSTPTRFRFLNNADKTNTLEPGVGLYPENSQQFFNYVQSNTDVSSTYNRFFIVPKDSSANDTFLDQIYPNRASYFTRLAQNMFTINIYGNPVLNAGDVLYMTIPSSVDQKQNEALSGYYLAVTINHIFTQTYYHMKVDLFKNGFDTAISIGTTPTYVQSSNTIAGNT
jgi:hypothetical protein